ELEIEDARALIKNGVLAVAEGANMPTDLEALRAFHDAGVLFGPGKAANAGGVAVSGLEQSQNAQRVSWKANDVDTRLEQIMDEIHGKCCKWGGKVENKVNYVRGANLAGFSKVANAMLAYGVT
ncbi:MAG: NADP-specific glutamate dehydrogenase, partial [Planctomycetota bacterium]